VLRVVSSCGSCVRLLRAAPACGSCVRLLHGFFVRLLRAASSCGFYVQLLHCVELPRTHALYYCTILGERGYLPVGELCQRLTRLSDVLTRSEILDKGWRDGLARLAYDHLLLYSDKRTSWTLRRLRRGTLEPRARGMIRGRGAAHHSRF
jgi:hypothetical protein